MSLNNKGDAIRIEVNERQILQFLEPLTMNRLLINGRSNKLMDENLSSSTENRLSDDSLKLDHFHQSQSIYKRLFAISCVTFGLDVFSIYRSTLKHIKGVSYCASIASELQFISLYNFDKSYSRFRIVYLSFILYLVVKIPVMIIIGIIDLNQLPLNEEQNISRLNGTTYSNNQFPLLIALRKMMPSYYQTALELELKSTVSHLHSIGTLLTDLIMVQLIAFVYILCSCIMMPFIWNNQLLDAANYRFLLDPLTEIQRLDVITKRHLDKLINEAPRNKLFQQQLNSLPSFRLYNYSPMWHTKLYRYVIIIAVISSHGALLFQPVFYYIFVERVKKNFCEIGQFESCSISLLFNKQDFLCVGEYVLGVFILGLLHGFLFNLVVSNSICQLSFVDIVKEDLNRCLIVLRYSNSGYNRKTRKLSIQYDENLKPFNGAKFLIKNKNTIEQQNIELILLRTYIKLILTKDEVQRNAHFIGRILESLFFLSTMPGSLALSMRLFNKSDNDLLVVVSIAIFWLLTNPSLITGAFVYSRTIELEKIAWSILAELSVYQDMAPIRINSHSFNFESNIRVIAGRWRRLIESFALSSLNNSIDPFGTRLTYGRVLSLNYYALSIILLLRLN